MKRFEKNCVCDNAMVPQVSLRENVVVAAGAVVVANVESGRVMGVPARAK